jgi:TonB-dependent starch-binding outer membrane protein SusC
MPTKSSRARIRLIVVGGFLLSGFYVGSYGQDSSGTQTPSATTPTAVEKSQDQSATQHDSAGAQEPAASESPVMKPAEPEPAQAKAAESRDTNVMELDKDVVVGYGTMKKEDMTGSVISVKSEDLAKDAVFSVRKALQGQAAGVSITQNSGQPGRGITVRVRGVGTINNTDPLYVVDGTPMANIDFLNPDDIDAITVLKDASSAAIYGSRGANGVIMVSTKSGKAVTVKGAEIGEVKYNMYIGTASAWKRPDLCNASEYATLANKARTNTNDTAVTNHMEPLLASPSSLGAGTDWWKEVTNSNALIQSHSVSVSRSTDRLRYYLSGGYFSQDGILKGSDFEKATFRFNADNKVADWITLGDNLGIARSKMNNLNESDEWNSLLTNVYGFIPVKKIFDSTGNYTSGLPFNNVKNPVGVVAHNNSTNILTSITGTIYADVNLFNVLKLRSTFGLDLGFDDSSAFFPKFNCGPNDFNSNATVARRTQTDNMWNFENTITYQKDFAEEHHLKLLAGLTAQDVSRNFINATNSGTANNDSALRYLDATTSTTPSVGGLLTSNSLSSGFGRLEYDFAHRYLLTATYRRDGSSKFGPDSRWGNFPSVAGAWRISNEPFMKDVTFIEGLKLRFGWGITGNQQIDDYLYYTKATGAVGFNTNSNNAYPFGNDGNISPGNAYLSIGTRDIHWEEQKTTNVGLDLTCVGGRIEFVGDYFKKMTDDMLIQPSIPGDAGLQKAPMINGGSVENMGVELAANYREKLGGGFTSNLGVNFSTYKNKVISLGTGAAIMDGSFRNLDKVTKTEVGHPIGEFYGYKTNGLFQSQAEVDAFTYTKDGATQKVQPKAGPGDVRYVDDNHDGKWDQDYIGSPHPQFLAGLNLELGYKGFDLSGMLSIVYGNKIFNGARWYTDNSTGFYNFDRRMLNSWSGPGSTNDVNYPRLNYSDNNNGYISDRYVEDGSYARLKTLQLGYTLSDEISKKFWVKRARIYVGAENLFTMTKYMGLDPEIGIWGQVQGVVNQTLSAGIDRGTYPQARTFLVGVNLTL